MAGYTNDKPAYVEDNFGRRLDFHYNAVNGFIEFIDTPVGRFEYVYDQNNLIQVIRPDMNRKTYAYTDPHDPHNLTGVIDESGLEATYEYDDQDRAIASEYMGGTNRVTVTYDEGMSRSVTDAYGNTVTYELQSSQGIGRIKSSSGSCGSCPVGSGADYEITDRLRIKTKTDPLGNITTYTYDDLGNVTVKTEASGTPEERSVIYTWHPDHNQLTSITRESVSAPGQADITEFQYDANANLIRIIKTGYSGTGTVTLESMFAYDADGQIIQADGPRTDLSDITYFEYYQNDISQGLNRGMLKKTIDPLGNETLFENYNAWGKPGRVTDPDGSREQQSYDDNDNLIQTVNPDGNTTSYRYDSLNRLIRITQPGGIMTAFSYDGHDNLIQVTDAEGKNTDAVFNDFGKEISGLSPDTGAVAYAYDTAGNLISKTDANGTVTTYAYDALNRITAVHYPDQDIVYTWDQGANAQGRLTGVSDASGSVTYAYDVFGRMISAQSNILGHTYTTAYTYDDTGILTGMTYPSGRAVTYRIDSIGRVIEVTTTTDEGIQTLAENITYLPFGPGSGFDYGNGTPLALVFDQRYRITSIVDGNDGAIRNLNYTYDQTGNITGIMDGVDPTKTQSFAYDNLYRLTDAVGSYGSISYTYDTIGNRLTRTENGLVDTYTYEPGTNRLTAVLDDAGDTISAFSHDADGNTTSADSKTFTYNQNNRLIRASENGTTLGEYVYNAFGQRVIKSANGNTTIFLYAPTGNLIAEADETGEIVNEYIWLNGRLLAGVKKEKEDISTINASVEIAPKTLNIKSKGRLTCFIELPQGYDAADIAVESITLNDTVHAERTVITDYNHNGIPDLNAKFDRQALAAVIETGNAVVITVNGMVGDIAFTGTDTIRVIGKKQKTAEDDEDEDDYESDEDEEDDGEDEDNTVASDAGGDTASPVGTQVTREIVYFYHTDHLGTPKLVVDAAGNVVWKAEHMPFGLADVSVEDTGNAFRFPGQIFDAETGLHYNWNRFYDPVSGRYVTADPIGLGGGINLYAYSGNNPINYVDPLGLFFDGGIISIPIAYALGAAAIATGYIAGQYLQDIYENWNNAPYLWDENTEDQTQSEVPTSPPDGLVENPNRPGSWGEYDENGKFKEKWRYDKGRPEIKKGHGSEDHIHLDGKKKWYPVKRTSPCKN